MCDTREEEAVQFLVVGPDGRAFVAESAPGVTITTLGDERVYRLPDEVHDRCNERIEALQQRLDQRNEVLHHLMAESDWAEGVVVGPDPSAGRPVGGTAVLEAQLEEAKGLLREAEGQYDGEYDCLRCPICGVGWERGSDEPRHEENCKLAGFLADDGESGP